MIDRSPAPWAPIRGAIIPVPTSSARVGERTVSVVKADQQLYSAPIIAASLSIPQTLEFSGVVSPVSLATLTALLRGGSLQRKNRPYRGAIASRSWPS